MWDKKIQRGNIGKTNKLYNTYTGSDGQTYFVEADKISTTAQNDGQQRNYHKEMNDNDYWWEAGNMGGTSGSSFGNSRNNISTTY